MINTNNLRRNNLVTDEWYDSFKTILKVDSINEKGINLEIVDDGNWAEIAQRWIEPEYRSDTIFPIPITEEWILKAGYKTTDKHYYFHEDYSTITFRNDKFSYWVGEHDSFDLLEVHYFQNIIFALTGSEIVFSNNA